jgi:ABC-2 type transport system ATP-binding protein
VGCTRDRNVGLLFILDSIDTIRFLSYPRATTKRRGFNAGGQPVGLAVEMKGVWKTFRSGLVHRIRKKALRGVDFSVPEGVIWGILGPNGAGKTTMLSILANLLTPEQGLVRVLGEDIRTRSMAVLGRINFSSGHANFLWSLSVRENLEYFAMLYGLSGTRRKRKIEELLDIFELEEFAGVRFDELSTGTKQKLSLAKSLVNEPVLLFLDEPSVGLDPDVARRVRESVQRVHQEKGVTILMTTHNMREAEILCEKIAFLKEGAIRAFGSPQDLKEELRLGDVVTIFFQGSLSALPLNRLQGVYDFQVSDSSCRIIVDDHRKRLPQILEFFMNNKALITDLRIQEADLEEVFIALAR